MFAYCCFNQNKLEKSAYNKIRRNLIQSSSNFRRDKMRILFLVCFVSITTVTSFSEIETECEYAGFQDNGHICTIYYVRIQNSFTKLNILNADEFDFVKIDTKDSRFQIFPAELFEQMPKIEELRFSSALLQEIRDFTFRNATALKIFNAWNNILTEIGENTFRGAINLKEIRLSYNKIKKISPKAFDGLTNLREIDFEGNRLEVIEPETIASLTNLLNLHLSDNKIKFVHPKLFVNNLKMRYFDLSFNNLETFDFEIYSPFNRINIRNNKIDEDQLVTLNASNPSAKLWLFDARSNSISNINIDSSLNLKELRLNGNKIESLQNISKLSTLQILQIQQNELKHLTGINNIIGLSRLYLNENNITLTPGVFSSLRNLKCLKLTDVGISVFDFDWFEGLQNLNHLDIDQNKLKELDFTELGKKLPALKSIGMGFNLLNCSFFDKMEKYLNNCTKIEVYDRDDTDEGWCIEETNKAETHFLRNFLISVAIIGFSVTVLLAIGLLMKGFPNLRFRNTCTIRNNPNAGYTSDNQ